MRLRVFNTVTGEEPVCEDFTGMPLEAERRLGDLWNHHCAHLPDRGWKATMTAPGERQPSQTISG